MYTIWLDNGYHYTAHEHTYTNLRVATTQAKQVAAYDQSYYIVGNGALVSGIAHTRRPCVVRPPSHPTTTPNELDWPEVVPSHSLRLYRYDNYSPIVVGSYATMHALKTAVPKSRAPWVWQVRKGGEITHEGRSQRSLNRVASK